MFWVHKNKSLGREYQRATGDWKEFFARRHGGPWGSTRYMGGITKLSPGDTVIARSRSTSAFSSATSLTGHHPRLSIRPLFRKS